MSSNFNSLLRPSATLAFVAVAIFFSGQSILAFEGSERLSEHLDAIGLEKVSRSATEQKLDSQLLYLTREIDGKLAVDGVPTLVSRVSREADGRVLIDIAAPPSAELNQAINDIGGTVVHESTRWSSVRASVPPASLTSLANRTDVKRITRGMQPIAHTGSVTSEGDVAHNANISRSKFGATGAGMKVGVISDSADFSANAITLGDLPAGFTVLPDKFGSGDGEGTAMSEIVHDLAPGAEIFFASANGGKAAFADSILALRTAGCDIIVDDISYGNEWQFQDDEIGQAINTVVTSGALYLSSAGNEGSLKSGNSTTWEGDFSDGGESDDFLPLGRVHSFGTQNFNRMNEDQSDVVFQWSDEANTSANDYDLYILNADGTAVVSASTDTQDGDDTPIEIVDTVRPGERIVLFKASEAEPRYLRISCVGGPIEIGTAGQTIGHAATANCICVASSPAPDVVPDPFSASSVLDDASSDGPHKMFYAPDGTPFTPGDFLATGGVTLQTPALTAADGGVTSLPPGGLNPFFGTSAAAPHAAAIAALVWGRTPSLTSTQLRALLEDSCIDIEDPGFDINSGNGILMADLALARTRTPQEIWRESNFEVVLPIGDAAPDADPDFDRLSNVLEYATGGDPNAPGGSPIPTVSAGDEDFSFRYRRNPAATDVTLEFEHSSDFTTGSWSIFVPLSDALVSTADGIELRSVSFSREVARDFIRLKVTEP